MGLRSTLLPASLLTLAALSLGVLAAERAEGRQMLEPHFGEFEGFGFSVGFPQFQLEDAPLGTNDAPGIAPHVGSHGGTIAADSHGLLVLDRDTGKLVRTDADGEELASLAFGSWAGELVRDGASEFAYVADRTAHRVVRVRAGATLERVDSAKIREPHGLALSPDGKTLYVTSVADHELVALDTQTMRPRWRVELAAEPRAVAVSASGTRAIVGFLSTGALASVELGTHPSVSYIGLDPAQRVADPFTGEVFVDAAFSADGVGRGQVAAGGKPSIADTKDIGLRFARNVYSVGFIGDDIAIAPHQLSAPHLPSAGGEDLGTYGGGGGFTAPITHRVAMIDAEDSFAPRTAFAQIGLHQPRALAYDAGSDTLYLAGYGNDQVMAVAEVSRNTAHMSWSMALPSQGSGCAPDGLAVAGDRLFVHCELDRNLVRLDLGTVAQLGTPSASVGAVLGPSTRSEAAQRGAELFRRGEDPRVSTAGVMACASCHAEGRTDGLSWRIEGHNLQTPLLAGRLMGTHPFKWDGKDKDLPTSLTNTVGRLGGTGLSPAEVGDLQAFLESLPEPIAPSVTDAEAIARGKALFESEEAACAACHSGPGLADGVQHDLATNIGKVDTPSLIGLAHTAPYYHDGSARTLRALLTDKGSIHDMGSTAHLSSAELDDLIAYLESL
ncbi:MAG: c-type cytochrome [Enhygromyxa sp.]